MLEFRKPVQPAEGCTNSCTAKLVAPSEARKTLVERLLGLEVILTTALGISSLGISSLSFLTKVIDFQTSIQHPLLKVLWHRIGWGRMGMGGMGLFSLLQPLSAGSCTIS